MYNFYDCTRNKEEQNKTEFLLPGNLPAASASPGKCPLTPLVDGLFIWPKRPLLISRSVGYGLRGSPLTKKAKECL